MPNFKVVAVNPNEGVGGGGCVCGDTKQADCAPPYAVFYATETDSNISPHVVVCQACLEDGAASCLAYLDEQGSVDDA